jgi:hypothetical protein
MTTQPQSPSEQELREKLAAIEHERWASWQNYVHSFLTWSKDLQAWVLPHEWKDRWQMQINTPYSHLSEEEKQSDRDQVDRYWPLIAQAADKREQEAREDELLEIGLLAHKFEGEDSHCREIADAIDDRLAQLRQGRAAKDTNQKPAD